MPHREEPAGNQPTDAAQTARQAAAGDYPLEVSHAHMNRAYDNGEAVPFAQAVPWLIRYDGSWWVVYERGWLRVTDEPTAADIDQRAAQITEAEAKKSRDAAIRATVASQANQPGGELRNEPPASV